MYWFIFHKYRNLSNIENFTSTTSLSTYLMRLLDIDCERDWDLFLSIDPERERDLEWAGDLKIFIKQILNIQSYNEIEIKVT